MNADVVIIGGGPAGLTAAAALSRHGVSVLVLEREVEAGGIPRHSAHLGFGLRDVRRLESGPAYARRLVERARRAGAEIAVNATVTGWAGERTVEVTSPNGRTQVEAGAVILATGARERPRPARMIPGDRPSGVFTTGQLQNMVHRGGDIGGRLAIVVGAESVSWSAVLTLRHAGACTVLMTTEYATPPAYGVMTLAGRAALRVPIATQTRVVRIVGRDRVSAVEIEDGRSGARRTVDCDTVVFTADWIGDHELARLHGIELDDDTLGPLVDPALHTSRPGIFAAGNLIHPVDTADMAALDGRHVASPVLDWLRHGSAPGPSVRVRTGAGLRWVTPGLIGGAGPVTSLSAWARVPVRWPIVAVEQDGHTLARRRLAWPAAPGRVTRIPAAVLSSVDQGGGDVTVSLHTRL